MRTITQLTENYQQQNDSSQECSVQSNAKNANNNSDQASQASSDYGLSTKTLGWLWLAMQGLYPTKWNSAMGEMTSGDGSLSVQSRIWKRGLSGVSLQQITKAIDHLTDNHTPFIPDLGEFKALCVYRIGCPSVDSIVQILAVSVPRIGTIAERFKHPLALAVMTNENFDYHLFKTASTKNCLDMIKPIYDDLLQSGWDDFKPEHYKPQQAIEKSRDKAKAFDAIKNLSSVLGIDNTAHEKEKPLSAESGESKPSEQQIYAREQSKRKQLSDAAALIAEQPEQFLNNNNQESK